MFCSVGDSVRGFISPFLALGHCIYEPPNKPEPNMPGIDAVCCGSPPPHSAAAEEEEDTEDISAHSYVCKFNGQGDRWDCGESEYKRDVLQQVIRAHDNKDGRRTIDQLKDFGITVYLTERGNVNYPILRKVVEHASKSKASGSKNARCFLYKDENGRLYNLTLNNGSGGLAGSWQSTNTSFSGLQALVAMTVLSRVLPCYDDTGSYIYPGYLSLIIGIILSEEISFAWLNCSMFITGTPSVAAHTIISNFDSDWPRKLALLVLTLAGLSDLVDANGQKYLTLVGVAMSISILAANLGSRAWHFMNWKTLGQGRKVVPIISYVLAVFTGLLLPYIGFGKIQAGGKSAIQLIVMNALTVAIVFVLSGAEKVQQFLVNGSENCNQDNANITVGIWIALTSITCIFAAQKIKPNARYPSDDTDPILIEDPTSPVGYKVPNFPDFKIDPILLSGDELSCIGMKAVTVIGLFVGIGAGALVVSSGLYDYMEQVNNYLS
ncbi:hypothetical protein ACHAW6_015301 [Cyclotella cf. meneghiniana]